MSGWVFFPKKPVGPVDHAYVQERWVRTYRPNGPRWLLCGALLVGQVALLFITVVVLLGSTGAANVALSLTITVLTCIALGTLTLRLALTGIWVTDHAVRVISLTQYASWPWDQVVDVWFDRSGERRVMLTLADGRQVRTAAHPRSLDFVGRPLALDIAAETVQGWFALSRRPHP